MRVYGMTLLLVIVVCVVVGGCGKSPFGGKSPFDTGARVFGEEYPSGPGIVWIEYVPSSSGWIYIKDDAPVPVVNDFLVEAGYTPKVLETFYFDSGIIEIIHIGSDVDPSPLFPALQELEGVAFVALEMGVPLEGETVPQ